MAVVPSNWPWHLWPARTGILLSWYVHDHTNIVITGRYRWGHAVTSQKLFPPHLPLCVGQTELQFEGDGWPLSISLFRLFQSFA